MNNLKLKLSIGLLSTAAVIAVFLSLNLLNNQSGDVKVNAKPVSSSSQAVSSSGSLPVSSAVSSSVSSAPENIQITLTENLNNPVVKNPNQLKSSLVSANAILLDVKDRTILFDKNASQKIYPASMTKIMTAIVALEDDPEMDGEVVIPKSLIDQMNSMDASMAGFEADEKVRSIDLLYGAILPSGAECCIGLANQLEGSEQNFVGKMNQKAAALGLKNTHFMNTTGLHDPNHYTTVKELSVILSYALQNSTFRKVFSTSGYTTPATNKHPNGLTFRSTMFKNLGNAAVKNGKILGGKVGYTDEAGLCLASLAEINGREYILVTADAKNCYRAEIKDALTVYNSLAK